MESDVELTPAVAEQSNRIESREQVSEAVRKRRNLDGADLSGMDLAGMRFVGIKMEGVIGTREERSRSQHTGQCLENQVNGRLTAAARSPLVGGSVLLLVMAILPFDLDWGTM